MLDRAAILRLIPHQGLMCLLDTASHWDSEHIVCRSCSHHSAENPLRRDGTLSAVAGVEYGLQAAALHGALTEGRAEPRRLLAGLRDVVLHAASLDVPGILRIAAHVQHREPAALIYRFEVAAEPGGLLLGGLAVIAGVAGPHLP